MPVGHACNLDVAHIAGGQVLAQLHRQIAFHNLAVVQVHLHLEVGRARVGNHLVRVVLAVQEKAGNVALVDRLDQHFDALPRRLGGGPTQSADVGGIQAATL